jgi:hypothetical protein
MRPPAPRSACFALVVLGAVACASSKQALPPAHETPGRAVPVEHAELPPAHPPVLIAEPASGDDHVGRAARRLSVDQLRASLLAATGFTWVAQRNVSDPDSPTGTTRLPDADMLEALAATLGRADYLTTTKEGLDPALTFAKLSGDAARSACRASVVADVAIPEAHKRERRLLRHVGPQDTFSSNAPGVRENLAYLALRFWGRRVDPGDAGLGPLIVLFERASTAPASKDADGIDRAAATPADGWRAVCIAMATDPQFLTY